MVCLRCLHFLVSCGWFDFFFVLYALSLFRISDFNSWVIHGSLSFLLHTLCGMCLLTLASSPPLKMFQRLLISVPLVLSCCIFLCRLLTSSFMLSHFAFLYIGIFLGFCVLMAEFIFISA